MTLFSATVTLLLIMDPLGNIPAFLSVLKTIEDEQRRRRVLLRELFLALLVLLVFLFAGKYVLQGLGLREEAVRIGGGIVLFLISIRMIFPGHGGLMGELPAGEPFLVPLAVPLIAGPSSLAILILLGNSEPERWPTWLAAVLIAWLVTSAVMLASTLLYRLLGQKGLIALERLMGMVLVTLSVQMLLDGVSAYLFPH
ncbi:MAG: YhgN family NAAT transporter [bacterium]|jgi:multiple antibiotic resistance protein